MKRTRTRELIVRLLLVVPLLATGIALMPSPAAAASVCDTGFGQQAGGTFAGNVVVKANTRCFLSGTVIRGGVSVEPGAEFGAMGTEIRGSVTATGAIVVELNGGVVRGNVTVTGMSSGFPLLQVLEMTIRGNLVVSGNTNTYIQLYGNTVRGNMSVNDNLASTYFWLATNVVSANLNCSGNDPAPSLLGFPANSAGVAKTGQCAVL